MKLSLDDAYDDDFGFWAVSEEELKALGKRLAEDVKQKSKQLEDIETTYKGKLEQLYRAVMPLLHNLAANPEKEYIYWPNRTEKVKGFIDRVNAIVND